MKKIKKNQLSILLTAVLLGMLIIIQARSFSNVGDVLNRNTRADIFREIQILKATNDSLSDEIKSLEDQLKKLSNNTDAVVSIKQQINNYRLLTGKTDINGPGISIKIAGQGLKSIWLIDTVNELFLTGAEAVTVNGIRLTDKTDGFDTIPNGQILLNSMILNEPYTIEAIGDKTVLNNALTQPEGIIDRIRQNIPGINIQIEQKDIITMRASS